MTITRDRGIKYSEYIIETINYYYQDEASIYAHVETFYNCREMGYVLEVRSREDFDKAICIWIYANRNSDDPSITWSEVRAPKEYANMYSEEDYRIRTKSFKNVTDASLYCIYDVIKKYFDLA